MRRILLAIFLFTGIGSFAQPLKVLYIEGTVSYIKPQNNNKLKSGQILLDKSIFIGKNSRLIYHNGKKYATINEKGQYSYAQLLTILQSTESQILSSYAHYMYKELFHHPSQIQFDKSVGVERGEQKSQILIGDNPAISISDTIIWFIRSLEIVDTALSTIGEIVPVSLKPIEGKNVIDNELSFATFINDLGKIVITTRQHFIFRVKNESAQPVYFTLLDIQTDNKINVLILDDSNKSEKHKIEPGKTWDSPILQCFPPFGIEVWKLIATQKPFDIESFLNACQTSLNTSDKIEPFETLYAKSLNMKSESDGVREMKLNCEGQISIYSLTFEILK